MTQLDKIAADLEAAVKVRDSATLNIRELKQELIKELIKEDRWDLLDIRLDRFMYRKNR